MLPVAMAESPKMTMQYVMYFCFVDDIKFSHNRAHVVYGEAYN